MSEFRLISRQSRLIRPAARFLLYMTVAVLGAMQGCDESLPPRSGPKDIASGSLSAPFNLVPLVQEQTTGTEGNIPITFRNKYTEVLQDEALLQATVTVWVKDKPSFWRRTLHYTLANLKNPEVVNRKMLTLLPGQAAVLSMVWDQRTDGGIPFWLSGRMTKVTSARGETFYYSDSVRFVAQGSIQAFKNAAPVEAQPIEYNVVYRLDAMLTQLPDSLSYDQH